MNGLRLSDIAARIGMVLRGTDREVRGVNTLSAAGPEELSFLANPKYIGELATTQAAAVIVHPDHADAVACALISEHPYQDFGRTLTLFAHEQGCLSGVSAQAYIHPQAQVGERVTVYPFAFVGADTIIEDDVRIFPGCYIGEGCRVGQHSTLYPHVTLMAKTRIGKRCILHAGVVLGADGFGFSRGASGVEKIPQIGTVEIGDDVEIGANTAIDRAVLDVTRIGAGTKIDNLVQIGHNVQVGRDCFLVSQVGIAGSCVLGDNVTLAGQVGLAGHLHLGNNVTVGPQSGVAKDIPDGAVMGGSPAVDQSTFMRTLALMPRYPELFKRLAKVEKELEALRAAARETTPNV